MSLHNEVSPLFGGFFFVSLRVFLLLISLCNGVGLPTLGGLASPSLVWVWPHHYRRVELHLSYDDDDADDN